MRDQELHDYCSHPSRTLTLCPVACQHCGGINAKLAQFCAVNLSGAWRACNVNCRLENDGGLSATVATILEFS